MNYLVNLNLNKNQLQNAVIHPLANAPNTPVEGQIYYNSTDKFVYVYEGADWKPVGVIYKQGSSAGAVITGLDDKGNVTTTEVKGLTLNGITPVMGGSVTDGMTLEAAIKALDEAVKNAVAGGGEINQNAFSNVETAKQSTEVTDVAGNVNPVTISADAKTDTLKMTSGNKWVQVKGDAASKTITVGHKTSGVNAQAYGTAAKVPQITVDEAGHITAVTEQDITAAGIGADVAGAAEKVLGTAGDASTANTVYGAKKGVEEAKKAAEDAKTAADTKVASVGATDSSIVVGGTATAPTVGVQISKAPENALTLEADGLKVTTPKADEYSIVKKGTPTAGAFATYELTKNGQKVGEAIDIPKDYLVKSASLKTATGDADLSGFPDGTEYIDFVINAKDGQGDESHIYLNVESLAVVYSAGDGVEISPENKISAKVVAENGLSVDTTGIKMALAVSDSGPAQKDGKACAISGTDKAKLDGIEDGATANLITLNGQVEDAPIFYAPVDAGTAGQMLVSGGANKTPVWTPMHEIVHKHTEENKQLTAAGGAFEWKIASTTHKIENPAMTVQVFEVATGEIVMTDVKVNSATFEVTITINDVSKANTLNAGTYRAVLVG